MRMQLEDRHVYVPGRGDMTQPYASCPYCGKVTGFKRWRKDGEVCQEEFEGRTVFTPLKKKSQQKCKQCKKAIWKLVFEEKIVRSNTPDPKVEKETGLTKVDKAYVLCEIHAIMTKNVELELLLHGIKGKPFDLEAENARLERLRQDYEQRKRFGRIWRR